MEPASKPPPPQPVVAALPGLRSLRTMTARDDVEQGGPGEQAQGRPAGGVHESGFYGMATALTIAGSDSGGGAGIQADLKTFGAFGVFGTSAITAITAQNTTGVRAVEMLPVPLVEAQIAAVLDDVGADAIKTGMLGTSAIVEAVAAMLRARLLHAQGDPRGASEKLEQEMTILWNDGEPPLTMFALPLVTAGEWRLATGDARGADVLALRARTAAAIDSTALEQSGLAGRAELLHARAALAQGDTTEGRQALARAETALRNGYGPETSWVGAVRSLRDSL